MAGGMGLEPTVRVLETRGLPVNRPAYISALRIIDAEQHFVIGNLIVEIPLIETKKTTRGKVRCLQVTPSLVELCS